MFQLRANLCHAVQMWHVRKFLWQTNNLQIINSLIDKCNFILKLHFSFKDIVLYKRISYFSVNYRIINLSDDILKRDFFTKRFNMYFFKRMYLNNTSKDFDTHTQKDSPSAFYIYFYFNIYVIEHNITLTLVFIINK